MSRLSFQDATERIKAALDIVDVVQRHVVLKKAGRNYLGKCPFHNDKNPSMNVNPARRMFKCFSCGEGGDAISFLMKIERKTFGEVIRDLADEQGIEIAFEGRDPQVAAEQRDTRQKILDLNAAAQQWFAQRLQDADHQEVRSYLARRYPHPEQCAQAIAHFQIGYAPAGWENLTPQLKQQFGFVQASPDLLVTAGLSNTRDHGQGHYDRFRHRLIIPILDERGHVVAFGGRALSDEDKPKYLNSPETLVYHKSQILYGFYQARDSIRQRRSAVVMEGYFDVMSAHLAEVTEAVGTCGTAMTDQHLKLLTRFGAETVYLAFDSDEAGLKAALSAISLIEPFMQHTESLELKVLVVPGGKDPDDFIRAHGGEAFRALMGEARHYLRFKLDMVIRDLDVQTPEGRIQAANRLTPLLADIPRHTTRAEYLKEYAERIATSEEALDMEVRRHLQARGELPASTVRAFHNPKHKKAISQHAPTSLKSNRPLLTDNLPELRARLNSRLATVEKNLLLLTLYNVESFLTMMRLAASHSDGFQFTDAVSQEIWDGLQALYLTEFTPDAAMSPATKIDPSADSMLGTLMDKMNHLYCERPDVLQGFADLALSAETFGESLGLNDLTGSAFREKVVAIADEQLGQWAQSRRQQQLQQMKERLLRHNPDEGEAIDLMYQVRDCLQATPVPHGSEASPSTTDAAPSTSHVFKQ